MSKLTHRLVQSLRPYSFWLCLGLLLNVATVGLTLYLPILIGRTVDLFLGPGLIQWGIVSPLFVKMALVIGLTVVGEEGLSLLFGWISLQVTQDLRLTAMASLNRCPISYIDQEGHGTLLSTLITDCDQLTDGLLLGLSQAFRSSLTIVLTIVFMWRLNIVLTLLVLILTPLSLVSAHLIAKFSFHYFKETAELRSQSTNLAEEIFTQAATVRAQNEGGPAFERYQTILTPLQKAWTKALFVSAVAMPITRFINSCIYTLLACLGAFVVLKGGIGPFTGSLTVGGLTAFLAYANQYSKPFNTLSEVLTEGQNALACAERIFELIDHKPMQDQGQLHLSQPIKGHIRFEDVSFAYPDGKLVIDHFNLSIEPGQSVAIVGPTGSGKTTLINLLMRFYEPTSGRITIDGIDIRDIPRQELGQAVGMVLQDSWLQQASIWDNLIMGHGDLTKEEVLKVTKSLQADDFIRQLPEGYDSQIGSDSTGLSKGQEQLLSIARLMLRNTPLLILDEATSSIDTRTERIIQDAFDRLTENRTSIVIAHRLSTIEKADHIIVLDHGKIIEEGTHQTLLNQKGHYYQLHTV